MNSIINNWRDAEDFADKLGKADVLYCLKLSHGLMKVGRTKCMAARLRVLACHGLLKPLLQEFLVENVRGDVADAEARMLQALAAHSERVEKEVFRSIDTPAILQIMQSAASSARPQKKVVASADFDAIASGSNLYACMLPLAIERARSMGLHERARELQEFLNRTPAADLNGAVRFAVNGYPKAA